MDLCNTLAELSIDRVANARRKRLQDRALGGAPHCKDKWKFKLGLVRFVHLGEARELLRCQAAQTCTCLFRFGLLGQITGQRSLAGEVGVCTEKCTLLLLWPKNTLSTAFDSRATLAYRVSCWAVPHLRGLIYYSFHARSERGE